MRNISSLSFLFFFLFFVIFSINCKKNKVNNKSEGVKDSISLQIEDLTKKIKANAGNINNYYLRAKLYEKQNKLELAIKDMFVLISIDSSHYEHYNYLGDMLFKSNSFKSSIYCFTKSIALKPDLDYASVRLGEIFMYMANRENRQGTNRKQSFFYLDKALKVNKFNPKTYFLIAYNYLELKDTAKAILNFQASIEADADYFDSYMNLGLIYAAKKNKLAVTYYENALRLNPISIEVLYDIGKYYQDIDSLNKAIEYYRQILEQVEDHKSTNYNLGYIYFRLRQFDKSVQYFSTSISKNPYYKQAYYGRGLSYKNLGKKDLASKDFKKILEIDPTDKDAATELKKY